MLLNVTYFHVKSYYLTPGYVVTEIDLFQGYRELEYNDHVTF